MSRGDFWSRRKAAVAEEKAAAEPIVEAAPEIDEDEELSDAELLEKYELPDPDSLEEGDDFAAFMTARVPERLRNRALRKLWLTNPTLANVDGLVDYGEDFTDAATVIENMQTVYQVGKGMIQKILEDDEDAAEEGVDLAEEEAEPEPDDVAEEEIPTESVAIEDSLPEPPDAQIAAYSEPEFEPESLVKPRMRFSFSENG